MDVLRNSKLFETKTTEIAIINQILLIDSQDFQVNNLNCNTVPPDQHRPPWHFLMSSGIKGLPLEHVCYDNRPLSTNQCHSWSTTVNQPVRSNYFLSTNVSQPLLVNQCNSTLVNKPSLVNRYQSDQPLIESPEAKESHTFPISISWRTVLVGIRKLQGI